MARARTIKPGFFKNELLAELKPEAQLLFVGLWTLADKSGRLEDRPKRIAAEIFPYAKYDINELLFDLAESKEPFIIRYEHCGKFFIQVLTFLDHQNPHPKETPSEIPEYQADGNCRVIKRRVTEFPEQEMPITFSPLPITHSLVSLNGKPKPSKQDAPLPTGLSELLQKIKRVKLANPGELYEAWKAAYPNADIYKAILDCEAWAVSKRVTRSEQGWAKTLNNWLKKEQDGSRPNLSERVPSWEIPTLKKN